MVKTLASTISTFYLFISQVSQGLKMEEVVWFTLREPKEVLSSISISSIVICPLLWLWIWKKNISRKLHVAWTCSTCRGSHLSEGRLPSLGVKTTQDHTHQELWHRHQETGSPFLVWPIRCLCRRCGRGCIPDAPVLPAVEYNHGADEILQNISQGSSYKYLVSWVSRGE